MTFTLLPAVDVADGQAVRLSQADASSETRHGEPLEVAIQLQDAGAEWIHLVDLDAAFGRGSNAELLASVIEQLDVPVELSGGIHDDASLERALATDCRRIVLATTALADLGWCSRVVAAHGDRIAVGLDVRISHQADGDAQHVLLARGGTGPVGDLWETLTRLDEHGCARYIVTDVGRDGMLNGPNVELYEAIGQASATPLVASGGVSSLDDLQKLANMANVEGSIVGKALYASRFTLPEALAVVSTEQQ